MFCIFYHTFFFSIWGKSWEDRKLIDNSKLYDAFGHLRLQKHGLCWQTPVFKFLTTYLTLDIHIFFQDWVFETVNWKL